MNERVLSAIPTLDELARDPAKARELPPEVARDLLLQLAPLQEALRLQALQPPPTANGQPEAPAEPDRLLSPEAAAERLGLPVSRIRELCRIGRLPAFKEGKGWLLPSAALRKWVSERLDKPGISMIPSGYGTSDGTPAPPPARSHPVEIRRRPRGERPDSQAMGAGDDPRGRAGRTADPAPRCEGGDTGDRSSCGSATKEEG